MVAIQNGYRRSGGSWIKVYSAYAPMTVTMNDYWDDVDPSVSGYTFGPMQPNVTGGGPSKTYSWTYVSGNSFTINSPTSSSTTMTQVGKPPQGTYEGTYKVTVSDGTSSAFATFNVTIQRGNPL